MGEAKRRTKLREAAHALSKPLSRARFNIYAIGTRLSPTAYISEEISWWASLDERLIGVVARDKFDDDYLWQILARDKNGRFRSADLQINFSTQWYAEDALRFAIADAIKNKDIEVYGAQGDETNAPLDMLQLPIDHDPEALHPYFRVLAEDPGRAPARAVIREIGPWLTPKDPHLVGEFQKKGFDQRLWEIYLWAAFREFSLDVELLEAPDFRCTGPGIDFCVEATTVAPSESGVLATHPNPQTTEDTDKFLKDYMPMKFGSSLLGKLKKTNKDGLHYWEREESVGKPFLIAIADFHTPVDKSVPGSMIYTQSALYQYLYGERIYWEFVDDQLVIKPEKIGTHQYKDKTVPSGFFDLPDAENVSAVLFSNAGTIAKFDRMGVVAGFGAEGYLYQRIGLRYNPDPNAIMGIPFSEDVSDKSYEECWTQEIQVFHNPNAKIPLDFDSLPGATHHFMEDGILQSITPHDAVLSSYTLLFGTHENEAD